MTGFRSRRQDQTGFAAKARLIIVAVACLLAQACALQRQGALNAGDEAVPALSDGWFQSFDGARLGLSTWTPPEERSPTGSVGPPAVIIAVHGMNDYAGAFNAAGRWWAEQGAFVYAYDQRGFGRSPNPGIWADEAVLARDLRAIVDAARRRHPGARIAVVGESMGAAVAITAFASAEPPAADVLVLSGPGFRGWGALPPIYSASLWTSARLRPGWIVVPPRGLDITPTDNRQKQIEMWYDPYVLKETRIDSVYGVVSVMEAATKALDDLSPRTPTLLLYGAKDDIIPEAAVRRATRNLPAHVRTAYYAAGHHMLMNDLQAPAVWRDVLAFVRDPEAGLPSGAPQLPWLEPRAGRIAQGMSALN
jgi:acylglycerol lipase